MPPGNAFMYYFKSKAEKEKLRKDLETQAAADKAPMIHKVPRKLTQTDLMVTGRGADDSDKEPEDIIVKPKLEDTKTARKRLSMNLASAKYK